MVLLIFLGFHFIKQDSFEKRTLYNMKQYVTSLLILLQTPAPKSGIDLVLLFDLPDDIALKRAEGRTCKT